MVVLISGATGYLGTSVTKRLLQAGHHVIALVRARDSSLASDVEQIECDILTGDYPDLTGKNVAVCINCVGIIKEDLPHNITFQRLHVTFISHLLILLKRYKIPHLIHISALGTTKDARSMYHKTKYVAETLIKESGLLYTIFRPSFLFSEDDISINLFAKLIKSIHTMPLVALGRRKLRPVYKEDLAECICMALVGEVFYNKVYEIVGPDEYSYREFFSLIAKKTHTFWIPVPFPTRFILFVLKPFRHTALLPITYDQVIMLNGDNTASLEYTKDFPIHLHAFNQIFPYEHRME